MDLTFGRFTDSFKPKEKITFWNESVKLFDEGKYLDAYTLFFMYLSDDSVSNVSVAKTNGNIDATIVQGSKSVKVHIDKDGVKAESLLAKFDKLEFLL